MLRKRSQVSNVRHEHSSAIGSKLQNTHDIDILCSFRGYVRASTRQGMKHVLILLFPGQCKCNVASRGIKTQCFALLLMRGRAGIPGDVFELRTSTVVLRKNLRFELAFFAVVPPMFNYAESEYKLIGLHLRTKVLFHS